jgi:putative peptidoglycan lipid II flippase
LALGVMAVVFVALAGYDLIAGGALRSGSAASSATRSPSPKAKAGSVLATAPATAPSSLGSAAPSSPASSPAASPAEALTVASAAAFGPEGTSDGDNPGLAPRVVDGGGAWYSSWYTTPEFGELKAGTGILLDMGQPVTVKSVGLVLGERAVRADLVHPAAAELARHVPGKRLQCDSRRPPVSGLAAGLRW